MIEVSSNQKLIAGLYSVTRGLGFHGDRQVKKYLSPRPTMNSFKIEPEYAVIIVATKGLWSALSYDQVTDLVLQVN